VVEQKQIPTPDRNRVRSFNPAPSYLTDGHVTHTHIFGVCKTNGGRKLHNEELHNLYASPNNLRVTKSRRIR
jgi:hypothetical protein